MFIISIDGGLGNQMFQYAFYLSMKERFPDNKVYLDLSMLREGTHNGYELKRVFGIDAPLADLEDVVKCSEYCPAQIKNSTIINQLNKVRRILFGMKQSYIVQEDSSAFYEECFKLNALHSYYLRGVWANVRYFENIKEKVCNEFTFMQMQGEKNRLLRTKIENTNSISIHFRKGDYVKFGFEVLNEKYYHNAIEYMNTKVLNPQYFVFSDDICSAREVIGQQDNLVFVNENVGADSYIDMMLMSLCKHNIIANSTFSFWGAYLNKNPEKIVIYPSIPVKRCRYPYAASDWIAMY